MGASGSSRTSGVVASGIWSAINAIQRTTRPMVIGPSRCTWESSTPLSWRTGAICIILIALTTEIARISDQDADAALTKALRGRQGRLTKADAVAVSGLPAYAV